MLIHILIDIAVYTMHTKIQVVKARIMCKTWNILISIANIQNIDAKPQTYAKKTL